jgi:uncharacterized membrane-anchored protein
MANTPILQSSVNTSIGRQLLNKVPEVTLFFWLIKVLGTTVGETAADFLNVNLNFGLTGTSIVTGLLLAIALSFQFSSKKYTPALYWTSVVLISVFGTLVTDNLTDHLGLPLQYSTIIFSVLLAATFAAWYAKEKTLSIHSIFTRRREAFYWFTILFAFALGTASGDLMAEGLGLGYLVTGIIVAATIAVLAFAWKKGLNSILSFWLIYILTRPLGASFGDLLSQPNSHGGLGLGATVTSAIFLVAILALVVFLTLTKKDVTTEEIVKRNEGQAPEQGNAVLQTAVTLALLIGISAGGYFFQRSRLQSSEAASSSSTASGTSSAGTAMPGQATSPLGDVSTFRTITQDTLNLVNKGDLAGANTRVNDLEYEWDNAQSRLKSKNGAEWSKIDGKIDTVLRNLRSTHPDLAASKNSLEELLTVLK